MTRIGAQVGGVNLAQGLPDFDPPRELVRALKRVAGQSEFHQYAFTWGSPELRQDLAAKYARVNGIKVDADTGVTITCGVSEALCASVLALTEPGDEVLILEPWYENYLPACVIAGVTPRFVPLVEPGFHLDAAALEKAVTRKTRLLILNTPGNPTGRVFTREELADIARLCQRHGLIAVVDEIYERLTYDGRPHVSLGSLPGMEDRTVTLSGLGKTYAVTGWRIGWAVAAPELTLLIRKVHDYLTLCAPAPLQEAGRAALALPESFYVTQRKKYAVRRELLLSALAQTGLAFTPPEGAYYVMVDARALGWRDDYALLDHLIHKVGVIAVPGTSFYTRRGGGKTSVRLNFAKREETLREAARRLTSVDLRNPALSRSRAARR